MKPLEEFLALIKGVPHHDMEGYRFWTPSFTMACRALGKIEDKYLHHPRGSVTMNWKAKFGPNTTWTVVYFCRLDSLTFEPST